MKSRCLDLVRLAAIALCAFGTAAQAAPIFVANFSFEDPAQSDGAFTTGVATSWVAPVNSGVWNPTVGQMAQGPTNGLQVGYSNSSTLSQTLAAVLTGNTLYTLMVDVLSRTDGFIAPNSTIQLQTAAGFVLATNTISSPAAGTDALQTLTFLATSGNAHLGEQLKIVLLAGGVQSDWDNVRLDGTPQAVNGVPEPGTLLLLGMGLILGFHSVRRKA